MVQAGSTARRSSHSTSWKGTWPVRSTVFIFNNGRWAIEDNLIGDAVRQTKDELVLYNRAFYDLISAHPRVCVCEDVGELAATLSHLETQIPLCARG